MLLVASVLCKLSSVIDHLQNPKETSEQCTCKPHSVLCVGSSCLKPHFGHWYSMVFLLGAEFPE